MNQSWDKISSCTYAYNENQIQFLFAVCATEDDAQHNYDNDVENSQNSPSADYLENITEENGNNYKLRTFYNSGNDMFAVEIRIDNTILKAWCYNHYKPDLINLLKSLGLDVVSE